MENQLPRLTTKELQNEALKFFNLEKGFIFTFIALIKKPYETVQTYLHVDRRKFSNPLQYVLISVALYTLIISIHPSFIKTMESIKEKNAKTYKPLEDKLEISIMEPFNKAQEVYLSYQNIFYLILIPAVSFITFLFFKRLYNYAEHLAINAFTFGTASWLSFILSSLTVFFEHFSFTMILIPLASYITTTYLYKNIFQLTWIKSVGLSLLVTISLMIISLIFQFGLTLVFMFT